MIILPYIIACWLERRGYYDQSAPVSPPATGSQAQKNGPPRSVSAIQINAFVRLQEELGGLYAENERLRAALSAERVARLGIGADRVRVIAANLGRI